MEKIALIIFILGILGAILRASVNATPPPKPKIKKYVVEVEITDPMVISEIQTLKQLQDVYNAQIQQQHELLDIVRLKYTRACDHIDEQYEEMNYTSKIGGDIDINSKLYKSKIAELSEIRNELYGNMLKVEERICKLMSKSDDITRKLDKIGHREYKKQSQS